MWLRSVINNRWLGRGCKGWRRRLICRTIGSWRRSSIHRWCRRTSEVNMFSWTWLILNEAYEMNVYMGVGMSSAWCGEGRRWEDEMQDWSVLPTSLCLIFDQRYIVLFSAHSCMQLVKDMQARRCTSLHRSTNRDVSFPPIRM